MEQQFAPVRRGQRGGWAERHPGGLGAVGQRDHRHRVGPGVRHEQLVAAERERRGTGPDPDLTDLSGRRSAEGQPPDARERHHELSVPGRQDGRRIARGGGDRPQVQDPGAPVHPGIAGDQVVHRKQPDAVRQEHSPANVIRTGVHPGVELLMDDGDLLPVRSERESPQVVAGQFERALERAGRRIEQGESPAEGVRHQQMLRVEEEQLPGLERQPSGPGGLERHARPDPELVAPHLARPQARNGERLLLDDRAPGVAAGRERSVHRKDRSAPRRREEIPARRAGPDVVLHPEDQQPAPPVVHRQQPGRVAGGARQHGQRCDVAAHRRLPEERAVRGPDHAHRAGPVSHDDGVSAPGE